MASWSEWRPCPGAASQAFGFQRPMMLPSGSASQAKWPRRGDFDRRHKRLAAERFGLRQVRLQVVRLDVEGDVVVRLMAE